jgi:Rap1a immunity proteins
MRSILLLFVLVVLTLLAPMAAAEKTAKELNDECQSKIAIERGRCLGYIEGLLDADLVDPSDRGTNPTSSYLAARNPDESQDRFFREYKTDQLRESFTVFLDKHPDLGPLAASSILTSAWRADHMTRIVKRRDP